MLIKLFLTMVVVSLVMIMIAWILDVCTYGYFAKALNVVCIITAVLGVIAALQRIWF